MSAGVMMARPQNDENNFDANEPPAVDDVTVAVAETAEALEPVESINISTEEVSDPTTATPLACEDLYPMCAVQVAAIQGGCEAAANDDIKANCRKSCGLCDDIELQEKIMEKLECKDKDDYLCANIKQDPSICMTSQLHRATCPKSCNTCDIKEEEIIEFLAEENSNDEFSNYDLTNLFTMEANNQEELLSEFFKKKQCRDVYPDQCQKLIDLGSESIGCQQSQLRSFCAVSCGSCDEILENYKNALDAMMEDQEEEREQGVIEDIDVDIPNNDDTGTLEGISDIVEETEDSTEMEEVVEDNQELPAEEGQADEEIAEVEETSDAAAAADSSDEPETEQAAENPIIEKTEESVEDQQETETSEPVDEEVEDESVESEESDSESTETATEQEIQQSESVADNSDDNSASNPQKFSITAIALVFAFLLN